MKAGSQQTAPLLLNGHQATEAGRISDPGCRRVRLLTVSKTAELLAIDRSTVYRLTQRVNDPLPVVRFGRRATRVPLEKLERWVSRQEGLPA